jgi:hypothetical protein
MRRRGPDTAGKARHSNTERHRHSGLISIRAERVIDLASEDLSVPTTECRTERLASGGPGAGDRRSRHA